MTNIRLRYVQAWVDCEGRAHHYFRRPGFPRVRLPGLPGSAEFNRAYEIAMAATPMPIGVKRHKPGSIAAAVAAYFDSTLYFGSKAKGTQTMRRGILERLREEHGEVSVASMPPQFIIAVLEKKRPHAARNWFKTIRAFCQFCLAKGLIKSDPTQGVKLPKLKKSDGHHTWTADEVAQFEVCHPIGSKARLALALGVYTLQRRGDVVQMGRQHIGSGEVIKVGALTIDRWLRSMKQQKTGTPYHLPIFPQLQAILDATPTGHLTFLVTKSGQPYNPGDFSEQFRAWCDEAGLPQRCVFHGLRKYGCVWFAEKGCGAPEIASWSGHMSLREVERYIREANQKKLARNAIVRVLSADAAEQNGSKSVKLERPKVSNKLKRLKKKTAG